jgi:hypothetical protein
MKQSVMAILVGPSRYKQYALFIFSNLENILLAEKEKNPTIIIINSNMYIYRYQAGNKHRLLLPAALVIYYLPHLLLQKNDNK